MTLAKDVPTMLDQLTELYLIRHPEDTKRTTAIRLLIRDLAIRELYAEDVEQFGSFEKAKEMAKKYV